MKTNIYARTLLIFLVFFTLLNVACQTENSDFRKVRDQAATLTAGQKAAMNLVGDNKLQDVAPNLWAIDKASSVAVGTFMVFNESRNLAIFVAQGGLAPNGSPYTYIGTIDITHNAIVDANRQFEMLGIDLGDVRNLEELKAMLRNNGFSELTETALPTLLATIQLGMRYMKTAAVAASEAAGETIVDILAVPAQMLTPEMLYPWCEQGNGCQTIEQ